MRESVPHEITLVLDRVHSLLSTSPLNDEALHHDIYIINSYRLSRYLFLKDVGFGANANLGVCRRTFSQDEYSCHCFVTVL
jgi:hypothetical protein